MTDFQPICLKEDHVPCDVGDCKDCGLFEQGSRMIWGEGNPQAPILVILDNPGAREDKDGQPYVCGTRETLQKAASEAGVQLDNLYITYILKRRPRKAYDKPKTRHICIKHLHRQIQDLKPAYALCLGNVAVQSFFDDSEAEVKTLRGDWHEVNGLPTTMSYHPLAVRRRPNLYKLFLEDWKRLAAGPPNTMLH